MNYLAIDYGIKNIGLAYSIGGIIFTLNPVLNNSTLYPTIKDLISTYRIGKVYVGLSEGKVAKSTLKFVNELSFMVKLPVETVEESVSTIEAADILKKSKGREQFIDSVSAAVILHRVIG